MKKMIASLIAAIMGIFPVIAAENKTEYNFVSIENLIEQEVGRLLIPEIYKKLGYTANINPMPGKRAQQEATSGSKDGEIMRIFTYGQENPTTIRVPTPYYYLETMGFVKRGSGIKINDKSDLARYRLVKVRGVKHTNNISAGLSKVQDIGSTERMMKFLNFGRADIALTNTVDGMLTLQKLGFTDIVPLDKPLATLELFNYIHESNKHLVPEVDSAIKEMLQDGSLKALIEDAENQVISQLLKQ
ncbi:MAG: substrate-binding periplasmic protein [Arenicella sp.]